MTSLLELKDTVYKVKLNFSNRLSGSHLLETFELTADKPDARPLFPAGDPCPRFPKVPGHKPFT